MTAFALTMKGEREGGREEAKTKFKALRSSSSLLPTLRGILGNA